MIYHLNIVIFHGCVKLPEGMCCCFLPDMLCCECQSSQGERISQAVVFVEALSFKPPAAGWFHFFAKHNSEKTQLPDVPSTFLHSSSVFPRQSMNHIFILDVSFKNFNHVHPNSRTHHKKKKQVEFHWKWKKNHQRSWEFSGNSRISMPFDSKFRKKIQSPRSDRSGHGGRDLLSLAAPRQIM